MQPSPTATARPMYGVIDLNDGVDARDYDPWEHAALLGLPIVFRHDLPSGMVACYAHEHGAVFVRPGLHGAVERCAIAHEIVHFEHGDIGADPAQEERADRIAAQRLVRPFRLAELSGITEDPAVVALELHITEKVMRTYLRLARQGALPNRG